MYLKHLFQHNKFWFALVVMFIIAQLFINLKRGMVFSPFFHYGMYSEVMPPKPAYPIFEIVVNEEVLQAKDFTPQQWDKIMQPLIYFSKHSSWNQEMYGHVNRITGISNNTPYFNAIGKRNFYRWYEGYLRMLLKKEIRSVSIQQKNYTPAG